MGLCLLLLPTLAPAEEADGSGWQTALRLTAVGADAQALPFLQALVARAPFNKRYRYELAMVLFRMERDVRSKFHLKRLLGVDLNASERRLVNRMISKLNARKVWSAHLSFNLKPESNGTKQTEGQVVVIGGFPLTLDEAAIGKPAVSAVVNAGFTYSPTIQQGVKAKLSLNAFLKHSNQNILNDYQLIGRMGLSFHHNPLQYWEGGVKFGTRYTAGEHYSDVFGLYASHARRIGNSGTLRVSGEISRAFRRYDRADVDRSFLSVGYSQQFRGNAAANVRAFIDATNTDQLNLDGVRHGVSIGGSYAFDGGLVAGLTIRGEIESRTGVSPFFGVARKDHKLGLDLSIHHQKFQIGSFAPQVRFGIEKNKSNIPIAQYLNRSITLGFTRKF